MNKLTLVLAAAAVAALPVSSNAAGLTTTVNSTTKAVTTTVAGASLTDKSSFADVMGTLSTNSSSASSTTTNLASIKTGSNVSIVLVSKLKGYSVGGLKLSKADAASMAKLDAKVAASATLTAALKKKGYTPSDVVAVSVDAQGNATVFVAK